MSNSRLVDWFDQLLFGNPNPCPPPVEAKNLILRMESENVAWQHSILNGGLTAFHYQIHGDLFSLLDHLEKQWIDKDPSHDSPVFKTRVVSKFWDQLQILLARRSEPTRESLPVPSKTDDETLDEILKSPTPNRDLNFESPEFWGNVALKFIHLTRSEKASPLPDLDSDNHKRIVRLYEITCKARGRYYDPLTMQLVPRSEYLNAVHWQTGRNLETFMSNRPEHPLTVSIRVLFEKCVNDLINGEKPSILTYSCPQIDALLHNIKIIHVEIEQVPHQNTPPRLIDIFQRLLALCHKDGLWERDVPKIKPEPISPSLLYLTEKIRILEREKNLLWSIENNSQSDPERPRHTCSNYLYANRTKYHW